jgi:hypothetical protein
VVLLFETGGGATTCERGVTFPVLGVGAVSDDFICVL